MLVVNTVEDAVRRANELYEEDGNHRIVMYRWAKDPIKPRFGDWGGRWQFSIRKGNPISTAGKELRLKGQFRICYCTSRPNQIKELKKRYDKYGYPF